MTSELGILWSEDVARILSEEARAAHARRVLTKRLVPEVRDTADLLPDVTLRTPPSEVDRAIAGLKGELHAWAGSTTTPDDGEDVVGRIVENLRRLVQRARQEFSGPGFHPENPHVKAARRALNRLAELIDTEWDDRKQPSISQATVWAYVDKSYPAGPRRNNQGVQLARHPIPPPLASRERERMLGGTHGRRRGGRPLMWYAHQEDDLRRWYRGRPLPGSGGGRPRRDPNPTTD